MRRALTAFLILLFSVPAIASEGYDLLLKAGVLISAGRNNEAVSILSSAIAIKKDHRLFILRGDANAGSGDYQAAIADYMSASSLEPLSGEYGMARVFALRRDVKNALTHLAGHMRSDFRKSEKEILLDNAFSSIENTPEWRQFWKNEWYSSSELMTGEIEFLVSRGMNEDASNVFRELAGQYPSGEGTDYARAVMLYGNSRYEEASALLVRLTEKDRLNARYLMLLSKVQEASGNFSGLISTYSRLIDQEYLDAGLLLKRASAYRKTSEYVRAASDIERYLSINPDGREALSLAGKLEAERGDNLKAIEYFNRNIELNPGSAECYIDRANAHLVSKSWDGAIRDYSMALDINPANPDAWLNKGIARLNSGNGTDACHDFIKALNQGNKRAAGYVSKYCIR